MITVIRGGWVVAFDGTRHQVIPGGEVAVEGDRVIYAGPKYPGKADRVVGKDTWLVSPGFINLHVHIGVEVMHPFVDMPRKGGFSSSKEFVTRQGLYMEPVLSEEEQRLSAEYSLVQMMKCGSTTVVDASGGGTIWWLSEGPRYEEMLVDTAGRLGARVYLSPQSFKSARSYVDADGAVEWLWNEEMGLRVLEDAVRFCQKYGGSYGGLVQGILNPTNAASCSPGLLRATKVAAAENGLPIEIHVATFLYNVNEVRRQYGCSVVEHLHRVGFLGPEVILGHAFHLSGHPDVGGDPDGDLRLIAESGSSVAHSPLFFARLGQALHSLPRYLAAGVNVGMGTDMWPADMVGEMRLAWMVGKIVEKDAVYPTSRQVYDCATLGGARALQRDDLGRLAAGAKADVVCIDLGRYHTGPVLDPIRALLTCATGQDVETVFIDGREVIAGGRVVCANEGRLKDAAPGILGKLHAAAAARDPEGRTARELLAEA